MAEVIDIDSKRPHVNEHMRCTDCFREHVSVHPADVRRVWWECPHCGEVACKALDSPQVRG